LTCNFLLRFCEVEFMQRCVNTLISQLWNDYYLLILSLVTFVYCSVVRCCALPSNCIQYNCTVWNCVCCWSLLTKHDYRTSQYVTKYWVLMSLNLFFCMPKFYMLCIRHMFSPQYCMFWLIVVCRCWSLLWNWIICTILYCLGW